jgi:hypothetical protein
LLFAELGEINRSFSPEALTREAFIKTLWQVQDLVKTVPDRMQFWQEYLTPYMINQLLHDPGHSESCLQSLDRDFDNLCDFDALTEGLSTPEREVMQLLSNEYAGLEPAQAEAVFINSLRLAWLEHLETKFPVLRMPSARKFEQLQTELQAAMLEKQKLVAAMVLQRARERVYEGIQYNRLNNPVTYRDLLHQVTKKKKIWTLRQVIGEFSEELFNLMPCWMVSPESASALFPMRELFDVVVLDEASQCFAERGLPALFRGKQVIIAGDSQQLRPHDAYRARWEEESEEPEDELDSLLALAERFLPSVYLNGHYRSHSYELIQFSNRHFYKGKLRMVPLRPAAGTTECALVYERVNGVWQDQTNPAEAEYIAGRVLELLQQTPQKSMGIVTFNAPQQQLVHDKLEEAAAHQRLQLPETLFVKNIENVQGDERDIIIFSIGYAPAHDSGKMAMQFGSLNVQGGENRLNVAITRARERIIIVASIEPEQLRLTGIKNEGPKLLREYLHYVRTFSSEKHHSVEKPGVTENESELSKKVQDWSVSLPGGNRFNTKRWPGGDLMVTTAGELPLGILLTDDEPFHQALTVKGPMVYLPDLLGQKGWPHLRISSRNWWIHPEELQHDILKWMHRMVH